MTQLTASRDAECLQPVGSFNGEGVAAGLGWQRQALITRTSANRPPNGLQWKAGWRTFSRLIKTSLVRAFNEIDANSKVLQWSAKQPADLSKASRAVHRLARGSMSLLAARGSYTNKQKNVFSVQVLKRGLQPPCWRKWWIPKIAPYKLPSWYTKPA